MPAPKPQNAALINLAQTLAETPLQSSDRACLITMPDGNSRVGLTQNMQHVVASGPFSGANFAKVSFRFAGEDPNFSNSFSETQDTAWYIVDHKAGLIQFGPIEGISIRHPNLGIGAYLFAQLTRILRQGQANDHYGIVDFPIPCDAQSRVSDADQADNDARIKRVFERSGFYISSASGQALLGVRRASDLMNFWNKDKIRFLSYGQLLETAAGANLDVLALRESAELVEGQVNEMRVALEASSLSSERAEAANTKSIAEKDAELEKLSSEVQSLSDEVARLTQLAATTAPTGRTYHAPHPTKSPRIEFELGPATRVLGWGALGVFTLSVIVGAITSALY